MGIYNRDNINYSTMIDNMIKNRMDRAQKRSDNIKKQGEIWGGFVKDLGGIAGRAYTASQYESEEEKLAKELEDLQKQKEMMKQQYSNLHSADMTDDDHVAFTEYMNSVYGGV